jgi:hypothetical protein
MTAGPLPLPGTRQHQLAGRPQGRRQEGRQRLPCARPTRHARSCGLCCRTRCAAAGSYQPSPGSTSCIDAPKGTVVSGAGAMAYTNCPNGFYQPATGKTACVPCGGGRRAGAREGNCAARACRRGAPLRPPAPPLPACEHGPWALHPHVPQALRHTYRPPSLSFPSGPDDSRPRLHRRVGVRAAAAPARPGGPHGGGRRVDGPGRVRRAVLALPAAPGAGAGPQHHASRPHVHGARGPAAPPGRGRGRGRARRRCARRAGGHGSSRPGCRKAPLATPTRA